GLNKGISEPLASLDSDYSDAPFHDPQLTVESPSIAPESVDSTAWPQMDRNVAYIGIVGKIVETIEPHTESDPNAVLIQLLGACGNSLGRTAFYKVDGARHYANIYSVLVGKSSKGRKGTSWQRVREFADWADEEWNKKCVKSGLVSGEGLKWEVRDAV